MSTNRMPVLDLPAMKRPPVVELDRTAFAGRQSSKSTSNGVRFGVVGYGYWGPNIVRNLQAIQHGDVVAVCDKRPDALARAQRSYPAIKHTTDFNAVLTAPDIDAIA